MTDAPAPHEQSEPVRTQTRRAPICFGWSWAIMIAGALLTFGGLRAKTTVEYSDTLNIGLLQDQMIFVQSGVALFCTGIVAFFISTVIDVLERRD